MEQRFLNFADGDAVKAEVNRLRPGYQQSGSWNLPQICWHLNTAISYTMRPGPHPQPPTPPDTAERLKKVLASGRIPSGIQSPEMAVPPADAPEAAIDQFLATIDSLKTFKGPFAPHRLFGSVPQADYLRLHLIHSAHHLGFLTPTAKS
jgi:hypothetical protein